MAAIAALGALAQGPRTGFDAMTRGSQADLVLSQVDAFVVLPRPCWANWPPLSLKSTLPSLPRLTPLYPPGLFARAMIVAVRVGALGGLYPAWRETRLCPIQALRYKSEILTLGLGPCKEEA
ncbi:MAG: ABC transporter permease [Anaerolineae bacterium]|nr:ABC transporter permease [Anaerolineae bacterium]